MEEINHEGVNVVMGGKEWIVPPLTLKQLRRLSKNMATISALGSAPAPTALSDEVIDSVLEVVHSALSRNYPELTLEDLGDMVDMRNMVRVMNAVMGVSGLAAKPGE